MSQRKLEELKDMKTLKCDECGSLANEMYFNDETKEILSIICANCKRIFEKMIKGIGRANCTDPNCHKCGNRK